MFESLKKRFRGENGLAILAPMRGKVVAMSEVKDPTFAQEILGRGVAVLPREGVVRAPADGKIGVFFKTKHAFNIQAEGGVEILVHVGIDTVKLEGNYFVARKKEGDRVKAGEVLLEFDLSQIKNSGYDLITPIVIADMGKYQKLEYRAKGEVEENEEVMHLR